MQKVRNFKNLSKTEKILVWSFISISLISSIVLAVLVGAKTIEWNWITGYILGLLSSLISFWLVYLAVKQLIRTENHYLYYFMYIVRVGVYAIPFLLAFLIPGTPFYWIGVLIGLVPIVLFPYLNAFLIRSKANAENINQ